MGVLEGRGGLEDDGTGLGHRQRTVAAHEPGQVDALDQLQVKVVDAVRLAGVMRRHDVRMSEPTDRSHLAVEAFDGGGIVEPASGQDLEGYQAVQALVPGAIDCAHAAVAKEAEDLVRAYLPR